MSLYRLTQQSSIIRTSDNTVIPNDPANSDYQQYQLWLSQGNVPDPVPLSDLANNQIQIIKNSYNQAISNNVTYTNSVGTFEYQTDVNSRNNILSTITGFSLANTVPPNFYWRSANNVNVPFTLTELQELAQAMLSQGWTAFEKRTTLIDQILSANTANTITSVVW